MEDENLLEESESTYEDTELELEEEILDDEEDIEEVRAKLVRANLFAKQAIARAKKAEAKNKESKPEIRADVSPLTSSLTEEVIERKILKSQGLSEDLIDELTALAKVRGTSLLDTQKDPIYLAIKELKEKEEKEAKAKLPASRGSRTQKVGKDFNSEDLSEKEHKEMWRSSQK